MATASFSSEDVSHITHFDGTNFPLWKFQLLLAVENHEMEDILNGKEAIPPPASAGASAAAKRARAAKIKTWKSKDVACRNYIISTIDEKSQRSLMECKTANQMWNRMTSRYEQATTSNRHLLLHKFMSYEYEEGNDVIDHVTTITTLASQLKDIGLDIPDEQVITRVIMTLPPSYRQFVTTWNGKEDDKKTLDRLTSDLLKEEIYRKMSGLNTEDPTNKTFFAKKQRTTRVTNKKKAKEEANHQCSFCHKTGRKSTHPEDECWRKQAYLEGKRDGEKEASLAATSTKVTDDSSSSDEYAFHASHITTYDESKSWYADSCASSHMTEQRNIFFTFKLLKEGQRISASETMYYRLLA